jgi:hypothetical protein
MKLNFTKEKIGDVLPQDLSIKEIDNLLWDWAAMYAELDRRDKALREAVRRMMLGIPENEADRSDYARGILSAIDTLSKHFPNELKGK